jgi:hypothetical protein
VFLKTPRINGPNVENPGAPYTKEAFWTANADKIIIVTQADYVAARVQTYNYSTGTPGNFATAAGFLAAFATGASSIAGSGPPDTGVPLDASVIPSPEGLAHPVGGRWNADKRTTTYRIVMPASSSLAVKASQSAGFMQMCQRAISETRPYLKSQATDEWTNVPVNINDSGINFRDTDRFEEVHVALGQCKFVGVLVVSLRKNGFGSFDVGTVSCSGAYIDLYDWNYWADDIALGPVVLGSPRTASKVQAGHATLTDSTHSEAGKIFFTKVDINTGPFQLDP